MRNVTGGDNSRTLISRNSLTPIPCSSARPGILSKVDLENCHLYVRLAHTLPLRCEEPLNCAVSVQEHRDG